MDLGQFLREWNSDSPTVMVHTSGSTGTPKPMRVEKERMRASARITCDFLGLKAGDTALLCLPLDYIAGKMLVVRALERHMRLLSVPPSAHPLERLATAHLDFAAMVPLQVVESLKVPREREKLRAIRHLIIGGGAIDEQLAMQLRDFPHAVWSTYGMTETLSHIALRRLNGRGCSEWYTPFSTVSVDVDARGCLVIDAPLVCPSRLETNDRAEIASDRRRFRILGRVDNVIDTGGIKVQMEKVEEMLKPHLEDFFIVTKKKDPRFGEIVALLTESHRLGRVQEICDRVIFNRFMRPRLIVHIDRVPLTATGKPARAEAAKWLEQQGKMIER